MIVQCPACLRLVDISTAVANAHGLGLRCPQCQHIEVLPEVDGAVKAPPPRAEVSPSRAEPSAPRVAGVDAEVDTELVKAVHLVDGDNEAAAPLLMAFTDLLAAGWESDEEHKKLASRAQVGGQLALLGRAYREVRQARPDDARAAKGQDLVVNLAMSTMAPLQAGPVGRSPSRLAAKAAVILVGVVVALWAMSYISSTLNDLGGP